ncbi:MAG: hypothetical protein ACFCBW_10070 [Candidatus Competibacterales bacterium]
MAAVAHGQQTTQPVTVALTSSPPYSLFDAEVAPAERDPRGFNIDLWQATAEALDLNTQWRYLDSTVGVLKAVKAGEVDVGLVNFPTATVKIGLQVMVRTQQPIWQVVLQSIRGLLREISPQVLWTPLMILVGAAHLRWILDRLQPKAKRLFPGNYFKGVYEAGWWNISILLEWEGSRASAGLARTFDFIWHLSGLVLLSGLIGVLSAAFTLESVNDVIQDVEEIDGRPVAVVASNPQAADYLRRRYPATDIRPLDDLDAAIDALLAAEVDAVVHNGALLRQRAEALNAPVDTPRVTVLPPVLNLQRYGVVTADDHPLADSIAGLMTTFNQPQGLEESLVRRLAAKWQLPAGD